MKTKKNALTVIECLLFARKFMSVYIIFLINLEGWHSSSFKKNEEAQSQQIKITM